MSFQLISANTQSPICCTSMEPTATTAKSQPTQISRKRWTRTWPSNTSAQVLQMFFVKCFEGSQTNQFNQQFSAAFWNCVSNKQKRSSNNRNGNIVPWRYCWARCRKLNSNNPPAKKSLVMALQAQELATKISGTKPIKYEEWNLRNHIIPSSSYIMKSQYKACLVCDGMKLFKCYNPNEISSSFSLRHVLVPRTKIGPRLTEQNLQNGWIWILYQKQLEDKWENMDKGRNKVCVFIHPRHGGEHKRHAFQTGRRFGEKNL